MSESFRKRMLRYLNFERVTILILFSALLALSYRYLEQSKYSQSLSRTTKPQRLLNAIFYANELEGRLFPTGLFQGINSKKDISIKGPALLFLFSLSNCDICLSTELQFLKDFSKARIRSSDTHVLGISIDPKQSIPKLRKYKQINELNFPLLWDPKQTIKKWIPHGSYPLLLLVDRELKILHAHFPVVGDTSLIHQSYKVIERLLENPLIHMKHNKYQNGGKQS